MKIKELRQSLRLSQAAFGEMLGMPVRTIQNWEAYEKGAKGARKPPSYIYVLLGIIFYNKLKKNELPKEVTNFIKKSSDIASE